jgi:alcohol dehydrogenase/S-(hydroxymethyl)glutathione dehydrogenase/alcohol dehydrogenase
VVHGAAVSPVDTVAVIGCGGVGISVIQGARIAGARRIVAVDAVAGKLDAAHKFGATDGIVATSRDETITALHAIVPGGVDHAFEAVGRVGTAELAFSALSSTGAATILGLMPEGARLSIPADELVYGDRTLRGAYMGANRFLSDVAMFIDHYRGGRLDLDPMVTRVVDFTDIEQGLEAMGDPQTVRVVVDMSSTH